MKTLICVPCLDTVHTFFFQSMESLVRRPGTSVSISSSSLVYEARNLLARRAIEGNYDRVAWFDSDMRFPPDTLERMHEALDCGLEFVCGLYFTRRAPVQPCVYHGVDLKDGNPTATPFWDYGSDPFEIEACGFAGVMMTGELLRRVAEAYGPPFSPGFGFGEDFAFCLRAREAGAKLYCDPTIKLDHIGYAIINESTYLATKGG